MKFLLKLIVVFIFAVAAASGISIYQHGVGKFQKRLKRIAADIGHKLGGTAHEESPHHQPAPRATPFATPVQPLTSILPDNASAPVPANHVENHIGEEQERASVLASVQSSRAEWPLRIQNKRALEVPLVANGQVIGNMTVPVGSQLAIVAVNGERVTVNYQGATAEIAVSDTDLVERVEALRKIRVQAAAAKPSPAAASPAFTPPTGGLDSAAPGVNSSASGVNSSTHYFGVPAGK